MQPLPEPDAESRAHSDKTKHLVLDRIESNGGSISFAEYVHTVLYEPGFGYYASGTSKFGESGDFVTAPEISPVFGHVIAKQIAPVLRQTSGRQLLEFGAGSGALALQLLQRLQAMDQLPERYTIVEVSPDLQERQQAFLADCAADLLPIVEWVSEPPGDVSGVVIANEVLDALPFERFVIRDGEVWQQKIGRDGDDLSYVESPAPDLLNGMVRAIEADLGNALPEGFCSEVSPAVYHWTRDVCAAVTEGMAMFFDYGVSRTEFYAEDRNQGWLRCHFRHHAHNDALAWPGIQDLTCWVDFSLVAQAVTEAGCDLAGYVSQAHFLMSGGIDDEVPADKSLAEQLAWSASVKKLVMPGEMGEHIKCLGVMRGNFDVPAALSDMDRTYSL